MYVSTCIYVHEMSLCPVDISVRRSRSPVDLAERRERERRTCHQKDPISTILTETDDDDVPSLLCLPSIAILTSVAWKVDSVAWLH